MKLRHKLSLATITTSTLLTISLFSLVAIWQFREKDKKLEELFESQSILLEKHIQSFTSERHSDMNLVSSTVGLLWDSNRSKEIENLLYSTRNAYKVYQHLFIIDKEGKKLFDTSRISIGNKVLYPILDSILKDQRPGFLFYYDTDTFEKVLSFYSPIFNKNSQYVGTLIGNVGAGAFAQFANAGINLKERFFHEIGIVNAKKDLIYSTFKEISTNKDSIALIETTKDINTCEIVEKGDSYWHLSPIALGKDKVKHHSLTLLLKIKKSVFNKEIINLYKMMFSIFIIITLVLIWIGNFIAKNISQPIEDAAVAVSLIGIGDFETINNIKISNDESGRLVNQIQEMTIKIKELIEDQTKKSRMVTLGEMAGGVAHEINNPLQLIYAHTKVLKRHLEAPETSLEKTQKSIKIISETVERIAKIIKGLKSLSRDGQQDPFEYTSMDSILENTFIVCNEKFSSVGIVIRTSNSEENIHFDCRGGQISQVLLNLLNNAGDAIGNFSEKWILIDIQKKKNTLEIRVINSGPKISSSVAEKLFTPFFTTKSSGSGTGLGLSISQSIIESHQGKISIDSSHESTCFLIRLPLAHSMLDSNKQAS